MLYQRCKQFYQALTASISVAEQGFVADLLNEAEAKLFWGMNLPDQRHALNVAYTVQKKIAQVQKTVQTEILLRSALLHDVGKIKGDVSTFDKIVAVLADGFCRQWARRWARFGRGRRIDNIRHALYIYYFHAERGAALLAECGAEQALLKLVASHHQPGLAADSTELLILRQADEEN